MSARPTPLRWKRDDYEIQYDGHHLRVIRLDGKPLRLTWSELQAIKDRTCGPDACCIEVFPPARDVIDEIPMRHFWTVAPEELQRMGAWLGPRRTWEGKLACIQSIPEGGDHEHPSE